MKLEIKDYIRLFSHPGMRLLINDIALGGGYRGYGVVSIVRDDDFVCYIPKATVEQTAAEGLVLYGSEKVFDAYVQEFRDFQKDFLAACERIIAQNSLTGGLVQEFFDFSARCINYYKQTEFIFTDRPYLESRKGDNPELTTNLKKFESIKFEFRDFINLIYLGSTSYYLRILDKLGRQFEVSSDDLQQYTMTEILALFNGKKVEAGTIKQRFYRNVIIDEAGEFRIYWGEEADRIIKDFLGETEKSEEIRGTIVQPGKVSGRVVVIRPSWHNDQSGIKQAMEQMNQGDILVAETTSPDLMLAIRKAGAIVTDQGGLMSHAAIMSREMKVPGMVGCGNATKLLKTGDTVEVDADKGVVKILK